MFPSTKEADTRGQTILGVALIIGVVFLAATATLLTGSTLVQQVESGNNVRSAEYTLSQFDAEASLTAIDSNNNVRTAQLGYQREGQYSIKESGQVKVIKEDTINNTETVLVNESINSIVYTNPRAGTKLAYQAGGVWRLDGENASTMISSPEFHYNGETMTFPMISVSNESEIGSGEVTIRRTSQTKVYPNPSVSNPIRGDEIRVVIQSEYYNGWESFFRERVDDVVVETYPSNNTVVATLGKPNVPITFSDAIAAAGVSNGDTAVVAADGNAEINGPVAASGTTSTGAAGSINGNTTENEDINYTPLDNFLDTKVNDVEGGGTDIVVGDITPGMTLQDGKTYYDEDGFTLNNGEQVEAQLDGGNVSIVTEGDINIHGGEFVVTDGSGDTSHRMRIYSADGADLSMDGGAEMWVGAVNGNDASSVNSKYLQVYGSSTLQAGFRNDAYFEGVLYAPRTQDVNGVNTAFTGPDNKCSLSGGGGPYADFCAAGGNAEIDGALVGATTTVQQSAALNYDSQLASVTPNLAGASLPPPLTYMHITVNTVEIEDT